MNLCPFCEMEPRSRRALEMRLHRSEVTNSHVEEKMGWDVGVVNRHMSDHIEYTPEEALLVEDMRTESIDTLNTAESLLQRMMGWLDELEHQKNIEGISPELVASFTKLVGQCNTSLKLVGQLKKEIGVDSQLFLADQREAATARSLVDVLRGQPHLLDQVELRLAALKTPTHVIEYDGEVR